MHKEFRVYFQGGYWRVDRLVKFLHFWRWWVRMYAKFGFYSTSKFFSKEEALRFVQKLLRKEEKKKKAETDGVERFSAEQILSMDIPNPVPPRRPTPPSAPPPSPVPPATRVVKEMW